MSDDQQRRSWLNLSDEQKAMLEKQIRATRPDQIQSNVIQPRPQGSIVPLSFTQERLWFLDQLEPGSIIYNRPWALRLRGTLNVLVLERCLNEIVRRHEALRTTFSSTDGKPHQIVQSFQEFQIPIVDLSHLSKEEREIKALQISQKETRRPFNLTRDLMLRPFLIRLDTVEHILLLTTHHIAFDGWSERILLHELTKLYEAFSAKKPSPLTEPLIKFPDYAYWEKNNLRGDDLNRLVDFWKKELQDAPPLLKLQTDRPRQNVQTYRGATRSIQIDEDLTNAIKTLSQAEGTTLYMTLLLAFNITLFLHSGLTDIIVGTPVAGRRYRELEEVIGFFVNTLVLRTSLEGDPTVRQLLQRVRKRVLTAFDHQDIPFDKLVEVINPPRDVSYSPIVQVTFALRNIPIGSSSFSDCEVSEYKFDSGIARFDLGMEIEENQGRLSCTLYFNQDLFDEKTADQILEQFKDTLHITTLNPDRKLSSLSLQPETLDSVRKPASSIQIDGDLYENSNLTGTQLLIWIEHKLRPNEPVYNLAYIATIHSQIEPEHFRSALQTLINKSDALRTVIIEEDGIPYQIVRPHRHFPLLIFDFSNRENPELALREWVEPRAEMQFDLTNSLFDSALIKLTEKQWVWYFKIHHIIGDNASVEILFNQLQILYEKSLSGSLSEFPDLPQFNDYICFEKAYRSTSKFREVEAYWKNKYATSVEPLSFYSYRNTKRTAKSCRVSLDIGLARSKELFARAIREELFIKTKDASLLNIFTALIFTYLYRVSGNRDLSLAISFHNRSTPKFRNTIGLFAETLGFRIRIEENETFKSLIMKSGIEALETLKHRQYPLRNPIQSPIYEVTLNYHKVTFSKFLDLPVDFSRVFHNYSEDTLCIHIHDYGSTGSMNILFDFNQDIFPPHLQKLTINHFERILDSFLEEPDQLIDQVQLQTPEELKKILFDFNDTNHAFPVEHTVVQLIEEQARRTPDHCAVMDERESLTYAQLNTQANQLAHHLRGLGLQSEDRVGVFIDRSIEMVIAILAILKAGGAYVPLDPNLPKKRLDSMIADSNAAIMITKENLSNSLPNFQGHIIPLDNWQTFRDQSIENPAGGPHPDNLAYIIFTSGTTGVPKGVMVEHRSLVNFTHWARENWSLNQYDRVLQFTSFSWDTHIEEIFPALTSGSTIILRTENMIDTFQGFSKACQSLGVTVMDLPTAYWHDLTTAIAMDGIKLPDSLRLMIIGGERVLKDRVDAWFKHVDQSIRLVNTYGLTESTCIATQYDITQEFSPETRGVPIGKPINNVQTYVLDHHKKPLPIGLPGELWIGGISLARGYQNQHQLTQEYFTRNFLEGTPSDRLLRTGDLAHLLPDGNLEILGRIDQQVKIRGHRIEPGEIESALNEHPTVQESIVIPFADKSQEDHPAKNPERLVAYYIPNLTIEYDHENNDFRIFLQQKLPDYMIPSAYLALQSFPMTPNGKIDRDALPAPDIPTIGHTQTYHAPSSDLEHHLVAIWEEILQVKPIGVMDNFFELGGHSLLAVRLFSVIEKRIGVKIPMLSLFEAPNISHQAEIIMDQRSEKREPVAVAVEPNGTRPPFFCISPSVIDVLTYRELSRNLGDDQPFYALYSPRLGDWRESHELRKEIADQFIEKIQEIDSKGPYFIGGYSAGGAIALEIAQRIRNQGYDVGLLILFDTFGPHYPVLLPWVTPWMFNALLVLRRIESYLWKFRLLDWKGRLNYLRIPRIRSWLRDRYGEVRPSIQLKSGDARPHITMGRRNYKPEIYDGNVLLIRAKKGLLGIREDPKMGWGEIFTGNFEIFMVPGDHEAILFGPRVQNVAHKLNISFENALRPYR